MEILTKRPLSTKQFSLNSTLGLFTSLQCIQNTLLVAASSQTHTIWQIWSREETEKGLRFESNQLKSENLCIFEGGKKVTRL